MKPDFSPVKGTLALGLAAAFIEWGLQWISSQSNGHLWPPYLDIPRLLVLALYFRLLCHWSRTPFRRAFFPLLLLAACCLGRYHGFYPSLPTLLILAWIRSSECFRKPLLTTVMREGLLAGGVLLIGVLFPLKTAIGQGMMVWFYFLVQALYFVLFETGISKKRHAENRFERTFQRLERLLQNEAR